MIIIGILLSVNLFGSGQAALHSIRKLYKKAIAEDSHKNKIVCNTTLAAVGLQTTTITFYHLPGQASPERDPYRMRYTLLKAVVEYNIAASVRYRTEYLYNRAGICVFFYRKIKTMNEKTKQIRYYFFRNRLFRIQRNNGKKTTLRTRRFSRKEMKKASRVLREAAVYRKAFLTTLKLEQTGK